MTLLEQLQPYLFWVLAILTSGCALFTMVSQNIVRSATWLFFTLAGTSGIFFLLGADFVGASQLLIYVGGTLILVVFGVMLTAQGPFITMKTTSLEWAISLIVGALIFGVLAIAALQAGRSTNPNLVARYAPKAPMSSNEGTAPYTDLIGRGFLGAGVGPATEVNGTTTRTAYLLPFEIVSVHLLVVLIGAAYLARAKRRRGVPAK